MVDSCIWHSRIAIGGKMESFGTIEISELNTLLMEKGKLNHLNLDLIFVFQGKKIRD